MPATPITQLLTKLRKPAKPREYERQHRHRIEQQYDTMNDLTEKQLQLLHRNGFLEHVETAAEAVDDPEGSLWIAIRDSGANDLLDLAAVIADETGWDADDAASTAREYWKTARKLIASKA